MDIAALKAELLTGHPETGAYDANDALAAGQLNAVNRTRNVVSVEGQQVFEAAPPAEYNALTADQKQVFLAICGMGTILVNGTNTKAALLAMFGDGTATRTNLAALQTESVSRATELGFGVIKVGYVQQARSA
jgi:hypothetical protein